MSGLGLFWIIVGGIAFNGLIYWISSIRRPSDYSFPKASEETKSVPKSDPEFEKKNLNLRMFIDLQEMYLIGAMDVIHFSSEREKLRYFHFVMGAIDMLANTIKGETRSYTWAWAAGVAYGSKLFDFEMIDTYLESYGVSSVPELQQAGERGQASMRTFILVSSGKLSKDNYDKYSTELSDVVRGLGLQ